MRKWYGDILGAALLVGALVTSAVAQDDEHLQPNSRLMQVNGDPIVCSLPPEGMDLSTAGEWQVFCAPVGIQLMRVCVERYERYLDCSVQQEGDNKGLKQGEQSS